MNLCKLVQVEHFNDVSFNLEILSSNLSRWVCRAEAFSKSKQILVVDIRLFLTCIITASWTTYAWHHIYMHISIKSFDREFRNYTMGYFRTTSVILDSTDLNWLYHVAYVSYDIYYMWRMCHFNECGTRTVTNAATPAVNCAKSDLSVIKSYHLSGQMWIYFG